MAANKSTTQKVATQVRISEYYYEILKRIAENEMRSVNAQIEYFVKLGIEKYLEEYPFMDPNAQQWI